MPLSFPMPNSQIPLASMVKGVLTSLYTRPGCCAAVSQFRFFERMRDCRDRVAIRGKATIKREDLTTEPFFHADPLFRMSRISTARRSVIYVMSGGSYEATIFCNGTYWEKHFSQGRN